MGRLSSPSPEEIQSWLEWAGQRLLSLQVRGTFPNSYRSFWPDYPDDKFTAYGYSGNRLRPAPPGKDEIPLMDEILGLVLIVPNEIQRRILNARALVAPINGRYLHSWSSIALLIHSDRRTVKNLHQKGLVFISGRVPGDKVGRFRSFVGLTQTTY